MPIEIRDLCGIHHLTINGNVQGCETRIQVPFIVISTDSDTVIQCEMTEDRQDVFFELNAPFEINDDTETMKRLQLHRAGVQEILQCIPQHMIQELPEDIRPDASLFPALKIERFTHRDTNLL